MYKTLSSFLAFEYLCSSNTYRYACSYIKLMRRAEAVRAISFTLHKTCAGWDTGHGVPRPSQFAHNAPTSLAPAFPGSVPPGRARPCSQAGVFDICVSILFALSSLSHVLGKFICANSSSPSSPGLSRYPRGSFMGSLPLAARAAGGMWKPPLLSLCCRPGAPMLVFTPLLQAALWFVPSAKHLTGGGVGKRDKT